MAKKKIRVLIVDDSIVFREVLARGIASDPEIEVVGMAADPFEARDKILEVEPDVMTCDVEMPKMNGIEFIRKLLPQYPIPVIVISTVSDAVFDALNAGAVEFVGKPDMNAAQRVENFLNELKIKIKVASVARIFPSLKDTAEKIENQLVDHSEKIIAIGASTGGTEAVCSILKRLPANIPGIVVVQHIPPVFSRMFAERLNNQTKLKVKEARTGDYLEQGMALVAPGDQHVKIKKIANRYRIECFTGEKVNGHCPSVDVLFESVAKEAGKNALGVILTGMGYDGAKGLLQMRRKGARTIGQDRDSCVVYGMPKVAYDIGAVERQTSLMNIPQLICTMLK
ncbi:MULTISPECIES: chemotaxis response regulator protein-glutamate methylesterase [unclassified Dehalobacter]|uniref:protein-glutamate methylesterase/protein-glutamine glutaminase n=1 Tax=unclassified Dehalobacter TaxID=2635733 RepID=UPI000E6D36B5|nr:MULTISPECIES: chemotaxis response regulator protein-glutamate methylesterase [unclassified Dehalobacter]RJE48680.1 chemotaxis response regulator protein-glutamate methylesterase [Dehalobacter sp. MCB1]TCX53405.1 chemotaxis response regulator protein-glutamate methylesterase [Dehalobacter sp. 14DCB1]TCX54420.1 chemotaxis response regulator protein-glutamate methylesterase [Dehalobacter sp. 12DCB1]